MYIAFAYMQFYRLCGCQFLLTIRSFVRFLRSILLLPSNTVYDETLGRSLGRTRAHGAGESGRTRLRIPPTHALTGD